MRGFAHARPRSAFRWPSMCAASWTRTLPGGLAGPIVPSFSISVNREGTDIASEKARMIGEATGSGKRRHADTP